MESNSNDNYVLVLEDRTEVKNEKEAGKLSIVSGGTLSNKSAQLSPQLSLGFSMNFKL